MPQGKEKGSGGNEDKEEDRREKSSVLYVEIHVIENRDIRH